MTTEPMTPESVQGEVVRYARISDDGKYRYTLGRRWSNSGDVARFIMLNPSTADADLDDPTIRRCTGFARSWGLSGIHVLNLYAYRATDPRDLWKVDDPVGPDNDTYLVLASETHDSPIIAAWGANARPERVERVRQLLVNRTIYCLGTTKAGAPKHPLYLPAKTELEVWP